MNNPIDQDPLAARCEGIISLCTDPRMEVIYSKFFPTSLLTLQAQIGVWRCTVRVECFLSTSTTRLRICSSSGCLLCLLSLCIVDNSEGNIVGPCSYRTILSRCEHSHILTEAPRISLRLQPTRWLRPIGFLSS